MGAYADLTIDQGTDFESTFDLVQDDGTPIDVTGYTFSGQVRKTYYSTNTAAIFTVSVINPFSGNTVLKIDAANTSNIPAGRYVYDIKMIDTANTTTMVVEGIITVTPQVTR